MIPTTRFAATCVLLTLCAAPAAAQSASPRGFVTVNAAAQGGAAEMTDRMVFQANAEAGSIESRYPGGAALLVDGGLGFRFWGPVGVAIAGSRSSATGTAAVRASVPHPFFDDHDRLVEGDASGISRTETAAHLQLFYQVPTVGRWRVRLFAGPSYVNLEQELVREVTVEETYPYDTATFESAVSSRAKGSGIGFNAGADVSWMFARRLGAGLLLRYTRASLDLNAPDSRSVSMDGGGLQAGAGIRFVF